MKKTIAQYKLNDKAEWIKFMVKILYQWHKRIKIMPKKKEQNIGESNVREHKIKKNLKTKRQIIWRQQNVIDLKRHSSIYTANWFSYSNWKFLSHC